MLSASSEKVGFGLIGLGWWGGVLANATEKGGAARVVTCFARNEESRSEFADKHMCRPATSLHDLLSDDEVKACSSPPLTRVTATSSSRRPLRESTCWWRSR